jgi:hypothetical protein
MNGSAEGDGAWSASHSKSSSSVDPGHVNRFFNPPRFLLLVSIPARSQCVCEMVSPLSRRVNARQEDKSVRFDSSLFPIKLSFEISRRILYARLFAKHAGISFSSVLARFKKLIGPFSRSRNRLTASHSRRLPCPSGEHRSCPL